MKTLSSFLTLLALAGINASLAIGCGCEPANNSRRTPIAFTPSSVQALRTSTCNGESFALELTGETDVAPPYTSITLYVGSAVPLNQQVPLNVSQSASSNVTNARSNDGSAQFSFQTGSNAAELDANPLDSVVVTVTSLPSADGQLLSAELYLTFADGRALDQVYSAPLHSIVVPCSQGVIGNGS